MSLGEQLRNSAKSRVLLRSLLYQRAVDLWGHRAQLRQLQEEAAEVIVEVNHVLRPGCPDGTYPPELADKLAEEMADLEILLEQMHVMGWTGLIEHHKAIKLERLKGRIEKAEENNR